MNLPNKLTILRIALAFIFIIFLFLPGFTAKALALILFVLASATDFLDGYLAKKNNEITDFGRLMDPVADKILILSAFLAFVQLQIVPAWMVVVIIFREVAISGLRALALAKGKVISADRGGKHKTVAQVAAIFIILVFVVLRETPYAHWAEGTERLYKDIIFALMVIVVALTLYSGVSYLIKNKEVYLNAKES